MIAENKVSLWLGCFENEQVFREYICESYDKDGNYVLSDFQKDFSIMRYDFDSVESDWFSHSFTDTESLLSGFSGDFVIIPQFSKMLQDTQIERFNSILLLYNYEYTGDLRFGGNLEYIGCADIDI